MSLRTWNTWNLNIKYKIKDFEGMTHEIDRTKWGSVAAVKARICDLTLYDKLELPRQYNDLLLLEITSTTGIEDVAALKQRIIEHVHVNTLNSWPTSLSRLNRIYGRVANRLKTSTRTVCDGLIEDGTLLVLARNGKVGLVSAKLWKELPDFLKMMGVEQHTAAYDEALDGWAAKTIR